MYWAFDSEGRAILLPSSDIPSLLLTNGPSEELKPIRQHDCSEAHKYLGLWNSPSLSMKPNLEALHKKGKSFAQRLFKSGLNTYEVWLAYFTSFVPAMVFTFAVCSFTMAELTSLQRAPVRSTLARLDFNRNISRDIVFGSTLYGGIRLLNLFVKQGIACSTATPHPPSSCSDSARKPDAHQAVLVASCRWLLIFPMDAPYS
jgi:hypothetical protein